MESALRLVIFGGEALDPASLEPWFARHGDDRAAPRQHVRHHRDDGPRHLSAAVRGRCPDGSRSGSRSVIGVPIPDLSLAVMDRSLQPAPDRRAGRAGGRRRRPRPRLPGPAGADRGALRAGPGRRPARSAALPVRRPGTLPAQRRRGVPRPAGPPGEDPRLPHRAGGDRGGALAAGRSPPGGSCWCARTAPATAGWSPMWSATSRSRSCASPCASGCRTTWCRPPS